MSRSPLFYFAAILLFLFTFITPAKDFFDIGFFRESPVVLFMAIFFIPFTIALALLTRQQFFKNV